MRTSSLLFTFIFSLFTVGIAEAQVAGSIAGAVTDVSGGVIPGVSVTATNIALGTQTVTMTDAQGL